MDTETELAIALYNLPALPEEYDGENAKQLVLYRQNDSNIKLGNPVSKHDAHRYCEREDTHGRDWFVGHRPAH